MISQNQTSSFQITGMDCADCARTIEEGVRRLPGVETSQLNFTTATLQVSGQVRPDTVVERVRELGYNVLDPEEAATRSSSGDEAASPGFLGYLLQRSETRLALLAAALVLPGLLFRELFPNLGVSSPLLDAASVGAMVLAGWPVAKRGINALRVNRQITINALMSIAAFGAVIIGAYTEAGVVIVLFVIGEALEGFTADRARRSIRSLMSAAPPEAVLLDSHGDHFHEKTVPVESLQPGNRILVRPGQRIPIDGRVAAGESAVNQAPITGESEPAEKAAGDAVFAGTVNGGGSLEIEVTRLASDSTIARMIRMVEQAQEKRAPTQRVVDRFSAVYTPLVMALAVAVAVIPPVFFGQPFLEGEAGWLYRGLVLLVVACPCALVISTPVSIISAISNAARRGVLFKGGAHLETLSRVRTVAFDKTGTLTLGRPAVVRVRSAGCETPEGSCTPCDDLLALASAIEQRSEHPVAHAVVHEARHRGVGFSYPAAEGVTALAGLGVTGLVAGEQVAIGSHPWFDRNIPHPDHCEEVRAADDAGLTTMLVSREDVYQGYIAVADKVRESSQPAVASLKALGLATVMLTGDNEKTARKVAGQVGVSDFRPNCLPEEKVSAVEALRLEGGEVAMVGDGINDTPALAAASVGIAMGTKDGTAQALEVADVTLMGEDLGQLSFAVRLARAAMRTIRANIAVSIGVKVLFLLLVMAGAGSMWLAVLADMGTSLLVTLNGMRLLRKPG